MVAGKRFFATGLAKKDPDLILSSDFPNPGTFNFKITQRGKD
jgi:hypothetical protein